MDASMGVCPMTEKESERKSGIHLRLPFMLERIEIEIFAEYKYTLNELLVTKIVFQYV